MLHFVEPQIEVRIKLQKKKERKEIKNGNFLPKNKQKNFVAIFGHFLLFFCILGRTAEELKAFLCQSDWWDHSFTIRKSTTKTSRSSINDVTYKIVAVLLNHCSTN